ncbi:hypothetical protein Bhz55_00102 [Stenotrophomonas phage vB_SmaS_Bhz55]
MKVATALGATVVMLAGMAYGYAQTNLYAVIQIDHLTGDEYVTDTYLTWDDCQATPHNMCIPMNEV